MPSLATTLTTATAFLVGLPAHLIAKLQRLQNAAARVVLGLKRWDHITPALQELHWLPVKFRVQFKILLIVFKALHNMAPAYIQDMITENKYERYSLRTCHQGKLVVPRFKRVTLGKRAFAVHGPMLWNTLPNELRLLGHLGVFKKELKTYLFRQFLKEC